MYALEHVGTIDSMSIPMSKKEQRLVEEGLRIITEDSFVIATKTKDDLCRFIAKVYFKMDGLVSETVFKAFISCKDELDQMLDEMYNYDYDSHIAYI